MHLFQFFGDRNIGIAYSYYPSYEPHCSKRMVE